RGMRVTDPATMRIVEMVLVGQINGEIVSLINSAGGNAVGLSGKDGGLILARRMTGASANGGDLGMGGEGVGVTPEVVGALQSKDFIPVIAPVGASIEGESLNINADVAAGKVAEAVEAEKLLLLTDVVGIKNANGELVPTLAAGEANKLIENGVIS